MDENKVAVLGGGNGAQTMAADLTLKGFQVVLCELPQFAGHEWFQKTMETRKIELTGSIQGLAKINLVTTNIKEALKHASVIFVIARSNADALFAEACIPYLEEGQIIVLGAGNCGSIVFANMFKDTGIRKNVVLVESVSLPYGCRIQSLTHPSEATHVRVLFNTIEFPVGVFPAKRKGEVLEKLKRFFPQTTVTENIIIAGLSNPNPMVHCAPTVVNVGRIERVETEKLGNFALYQEGFSESVIRVVITVMKERENIFKGLGWKPLRPTPDTTENFLRNQFSGCTPKEGVEEAWRSKGPMGPINDARYITEDVPYGLVTYSSFGKMVGVETPTIDAVIQLASVMTRANYMTEGRTVQKLRISALNLKQLNDYLYEGS
jgi:opine dehydrogenase